MVVDQKLTKIGNIQQITTNQLSYYRTENTFNSYADFQSPGEFIEYFNWAKENDFQIYILGNGSNTLFGRKNIKTVVLRNQIPKSIEVLSDNQIKVSSSVQVREVLKYCYENSLDSFYYLASVPATVGGALAMNAGRGKKFNVSIYDHVKSVDFFDSKDGCVKTLKPEDIVLGYRNTIFTGIQSSFVISAVFEFDKCSLNGNPIQERCRWSKKNQDYSAPSCGSVFKKFDYQILSKLKGYRVGKAKFSEKTNNWISNKSDSPINIKILILIAKLLHAIKRKKPVLEIIVVE
ncbi:MAG: FAD-binding protein [Leptolyngbya sp. SIO1E4]|nr:FAD-binding protein [Leptolyngbya sp. SIO1E4]